MTEACKLCRKSDSPIRNSHSIPKAVFRRMHSPEGKFVHFKVDENKLIPKAQDQGAELMLCHRCETFLNTHYENYALSILRDKYSAPDGKRLYWTNVDLHKINMFCLSVLWRSMVSKHGLYHAIPKVDSAIEFYSTYILNNVAIGRPKFAVRISRLDARTLGLPGDFMVGPLLNPTIARLHNDGVVVRFVYWGYLFEKYIFCFKHSVSDKTGIVMKNKKYLFIPDTDIRDHDFIMQPFAKMIHDFQAKQLT